MTYRELHTIMYLNMYTTLFWTFIGIPAGYVISELVNEGHKYIYHRNISRVCKYSIISIITCGSLLRGYTGNDLITNIYYTLETIYTNH